MKRVIRIVEGGAGPTAATAIAMAKSVLRREDLRAVALITVSRDGVGTLYGGADEGHFHQLISGCEQMKRRIMDDET
jgi:hypothetical protein